MENTKPHQFIQEKYFWDSQSIYELQTGAEFNWNSKQVGFWNQNNKGIIKNPNYLENKLNYVLIQFQL